MPLDLIRGTYRIKGASPDGDSVRFYPDKPRAFADAGIRVKANRAGGVQLRLDAIDALETHYTPPHAAQSWHQQVKFGGGAADRLLEILGFREVDRNRAGTVTSADPPDTHGYILTRFADTYGRAVALAYAGEPDERDGPIQVTVDRLRGSANYQLLAEGWVYPTFYSKLFFDLRAALAEAAKKARRDNKGVWDKDVTLSGFEVGSRADLTDRLVILPKLFRRLAEYLTLDETGGTDLSGFSAFLAAHNDRLFTVPEGHATSLDTLVRLDGQKVTLTKPPEEIVFLEK
jgi:endonuclease YncB( thermonuclease family)